MVVAVMGELRHHLGTGSGASSMKRSDEFGIAEMWIEAGGIYGDAILQAVFGGWRNSC